MAKQVKKARILTPSEKAANVKAGLTPNGYIPKPKYDKASRAPMGRAGDLRLYPGGDYRCRGTKFTTARKNTYVRIVRESGEEALARAETGIAIDTVREHKTKDPLFRDAVDEAYRQHASIYSREMTRRGVEGWQEPVFGPQGTGMGSGIVGWVTKYSDRLLLEQARRFNKEYTPRQVVEQTTKVKTSKGLGLEKLSPESREDLKRILERELANGTVIEPEEPEDSDEE